MDAFQLPEKVKTVSISFIILGAFQIFWLIIQAVIFIFVGIGLFAASKESSNAPSIAFPLYVFIVSAIFLFNAVIMVLSFLTAKAVKKRKKWSKVMGIILAVLAIVFGSVVGMGLGVFILINLLDKELEAWFIN